MKEKEPEKEKKKGNRKKAIRGILDGGFHDQPRRLLKIWHRSSNGRHIFAVFDVCSV